MAVGVCLVVLGLVGMWSLVLISSLLLGLCFVFAPRFIRCWSVGFVFAGALWWVVACFFC